MNGMIVQKTNLIATRVFFSFALIGTTTLITNFMEYESVSDFFVFLSTVNLLVLVLLWGGDIELSKHINNKEDFDSANFLCVVSNIYKCAAFIVVLLLFFFVILELNFPYFMGLVFSIILFPIVVASFVLRGLRKFQLFQLFRNGFFSIILLISVGSACYLGEDLLFVFYSCGFLFLLLYYVLFVNDKLYFNSNYNVKIDLSIFNVLCSRFPFFVIVFINTSFFWVDVYFARYYLASEEVALVGVMGRISAAINMIYLVLFNFYTPSISKACKELVPIKSFGRVFHFQLNVFFFGCVFCLFFLSFGEYILLVFGEEYRQLKEPLMVVVVGHFSLFMFGFFRSFLYFNNMQIVVAIISFLGFVIYFLSMVFMIPSYGVFGVAASFSLAMVSIVVSCFVYSLIYIKIKS